MEEGRKRVLGIMASILVTRHLKTPEDLHDSRSSPRTESLVTSAVQVGRAHHEKDRRHFPVNRRQTMAESLVRIGSQFF